MTPYISAVDRRALRAIADDAPRAIRDRLMAILLRVGPGESARLDTFEEATP